LKLVRHKGVSKLGKSASEALQTLQTVYGDNDFKKQLCMTGITSSEQELTASLTEKLQMMQDEMRWLLHHNNAPSCSHCIYQTSHRVSFGSSLD
jgi:hypothetical protein